MRSVLSNVFACYVALLHAQLCNEKTQTLPKEVLNRGSFKGQPYDVIVSHVVFTVFSVMCLWYWKKKKQRNQKIFTNLWETVQLWHPVGPKYHSATCKTHWQCGKKVQGKNCCGVQLSLTHILSDTHTSNIYLTNTHSHTLTRIRPICKYREVWMVFGRSWGKWRLLSACTCVCIQYKSKHVCLRLSTLEQYDESGYWLKGSLSFYQQIVPPTVVIIPMWTHTFTHSHAHREQQ